MLVRGSLRQRLRRNHETPPAKAVELIFLETLPAGDVTPDKHRTANNAVERWVWGDMQLLLDELRLELDQITPSL